MWSVVLLIGLLVEARGIEPRSESTTLKHLHAKPTYLIFGGQHAGRQAF